MNPQSQPGQPVSAGRDKYAILAAAGIYLLGALTTYLAGMLWTTLHTPPQPQLTPAQTAPPHDEVFAQWGEFKMTQAMVDGVEPEQVRYYRRKLFSLSVELYETRLNAIAQLLQNKATGDYLQSIQVPETDLVKVFGPDDDTLKTAYKPWCDEHFLTRCEVSGTYPESEKLAQFKQSWAEAQIAEQVEAIKQQHSLQIRLPAPVEVP